MTRSDVAPVYEFGPFRLDRVNEICWRSRCDSNPRPPADRPAPGGFITPKAAIASPSRPLRLAARLHRGSAESSGSRGDLDIV